MKRLQDGKVDITAQNHGFAVDPWSLSSAEPPSREGLVTRDLLPTDLESAFGAMIPTHQNLNDGTLEGFALPEAKAFGVQFHPEAAPGPRDATALFDEFLSLMGLAEDEKRNAHAAS